MGLLNSIFGKFNKENNNPCETIAQEIIKSASNCFQVMQSDISYKSETEIIVANISLFYEYIFFFMHTTIREAFEVMTRVQISKLQKLIGQPVASTAIYAHFAQCSEDLKNEQMQNFFKGLNNAELEYSTVSKLLSEGSLLDKDTTLYILGSRVMEVSGNRMDPMLYTKAILPVLDELKRVRFNLLVQEAAKRL